MKNIFIASVSLIAFLIIGACNKSSQLGADLFSGEKLNLSFSDTLITVVAQSENPDSVLALYSTATSLTNTTRLPMGKMYDPVFGVTDARIYTNLSYYSSRLFIDSAGVYTLDSANFVLTYAGEDVYGDTTQAQSIGLYRLDASESLSGTPLTYYSNKKFKTEATKIGGLSNFIPKPNTRVYVNDTVSYRPHISFKFDNQLALSLLDTGVNSLYNANGGDINKYFRGFEIRTDQTTNAMLSFNIADDSSGLFLYYHKANDTTKYSYRFQFSPTTTMPSFTHNYSTGTINKFYNGKKTISGDSLLFLQGMAGPNARFEFPNLKKQLGTTAINRAELEFTILEDSTDKYLPIERLLLTTAGGYPIGDISTLSASNLTSFGGTVVTEEGTIRRYRCNISKQLQDMLYGRVGTILYLVPDNTRGAIPNKQGTTRRVVLYGTKNPKYRAKLNLYYTKPQ